MDLLDVVLRGYLNPMEVHSPELGLHLLSDAFSALEISKITITHILLHPSDLEMLRDNTDAKEMLDLRIPDEPWLWGAQLVVDERLNPGEFWCIGDTFDPLDPSESAVVKAVVSEIILH